MIHNRKDITRYYLHKNPIEVENIEGILDRLSFKRYPSQVPEWSLFTRKNDNNEFTAIYGNKEFLVKGLYSNIDVPQRDLENITRYIFNEGWISRKIREKSMIPIFSYLSGGLGLSAYDLYNTINKNPTLLDGLQKYLKSIDPSAPSNANLMVVLIGIPAGIILTMGGQIIAGNLLNRYYASKLSKEAENYEYGWEAEKKIGTEFIFEKIKSGELKKQDFLRLMDGANLTQLHQFV